MYQNREGTIFIIDPPTGLSLTSECCSVEDAPLYITEYRIEDLAERRKTEGFITQHFHDHFRKFFIFPTYHAAKFVFAVVRYITEYRIEDLAERRKTEEYQIKAKMFKAFKKAAKVKEECEIMLKGIKKNEKI